MPQICRSVSITLPRHAELPSDGLARLSCACRFLDAQAAVYTDVIAELSTGEKRSHWMWFIFPQLARLGSSQMSEKYALANLDEAAAYLAHPVLGARLCQCAEFVVAAQILAVERMLPWPDNLKFHSSMTLFSQVHAHDEVFDSALGKYFAYQLDQRTLRLLR